MESQKPTVIKDHLDFLVHNPSLLSFNCESMILAVSTLLFAIPRCTQVHVFGFCSTNSEGTKN